MKRLAEEFKISIRLIFTEAGHGKSPCDGVGGNIKTQVESAMLNDFGKKEVEVIHSVKDVKKLIEERTNLKYEIYIHKKEDIEEVKESMPKLSALVGAFKLHEIMIEKSTVKKKDLPTDTFYKPVNIRESRIRREVNVNESELMVINENESELMNIAFIDDPMNPVEHNDDNDTSEIEVVRPKRKIIVTRAEILAELETNDDIEESDSD